jgi:DUF2971 family protein
MDLVFEPNANDVIYHYCSATTLQAIVTTRTIRFSDLNMLNDASEALWAYTVFEEAATRLLNRKGVPSSMPSIDLAFINAIDEIISPVQLIAHPFVACFSLEGDMLGQWRAYADDGRGFALGFNARILQKQLPARFLRVIYDRERQVTEMMQAIVATYLRQRDGVERAEFFEDCIWLATFMIAFKHPAFQDEREIRAVRVMNVEPNGNLLKFSNPGGTINENVKVEGSSVSFQVRDNHLVAYADSTFLYPGTDSPLVELVLGPKNHSAPGNLSLFLGGLGYRNISLRQSDAPYR